MTQTYWGFLTGNLMLDLAIVAWFAAQVLKLLLQLAVERRSDLRSILKSGGMPSSHSAFVCALAVSVGILYGWQSPYFALAAGLAAVVMYDACNVRWSTGEQAKALNLLLEDLDYNRKEEVMAAALFYHGRENEYEKDCLIAGMFAGVVFWRSVGLRGRDRLSYGRRDYANLC